MSGSLVIVGLGPGSIDLLTPAAAKALQAATDLVGYSPYLDRIPAATAGQRWMRPTVDTRRSSGSSMALCNDTGLVSVMP